MTAMYKIKNEKEVEFVNDVNVSSHIEFSTNKNGVFNASNIINQIKLETTELKNETLNLLKSVTSDLASSAQNEVDVSFSELNNYTQTIKLRYSVIDDTINFDKDEVLQDLELHLHIENKDDIIENIVSKFNPINNVLGIIVSIKQMNSEIRETKEKIITLEEYRDNIGSRSHDNSNKTQLLHKNNLDKITRKKQKLSSQEDKLRVYKENIFNKNNTLLHCNQDHPYVLNYKQAIEQLLNKTKVTSVPIINNTAKQLRDTNKRRRLSFKALGGIFIMATFALSYAGVKRYKKNQVELILKSPFLVKYLTHEKLITLRKSNSIDDLHEAKLGADLIHMERVKDVVNQNFVKTSPLIMDISSNPKAIRLTLPKDFLSFAKSVFGNELKSITYNIDDKTNSMKTVILSPNDLPTEISHRDLCGIELSELIKFNIELPHGFSMGFQFGLGRTKLDRIKNMLIRNGTCSKF